MAVDSQHENNKPSCDFCLRIEGCMPKRPWYDFHEIESSEGFVVVVALGPLTAGHIMVVTRHHIERMADLGASGLSELGALVEEWSRNLEKVWRRPVFIFEHGGRSKSCVPSCVAHAHLQMLPLSVDPLANYPGFHHLRSLKNLREVSTEDYLLASGFQGLRIKVSHAERGQFFRRRITASLDRPDQWDYLVFPSLDDMRQTIDRLTAQPRGGHLI